MDINKTWHIKMQQDEAPPRVLRLGKETLYEE